MSKDSMDTTRSITEVQDAISARISHLREGFACERDREYRRVMGLRDLCDIALMSVFKMPDNRLRIFLLTLVKSYCFVRHQGGHENGVD